MSVIIYKERVRRSKHTEHYENTLRACTHFSVRLTSQKYNKIIMRHDQLL